MHEHGWRVGRWVLAAGAVLSLTLAAGRITGLLREIQLAASFGVSATGDLAVLLLTLPDLLVNLLLSGGLSAALVPRLRALPAGEAAALFRQALLAVLIFFGLAALAVATWPGAVFALLAPGLSGIDLQLHRSALAAVALAMPLTAAAGVTSAYLNAHGRYFVPGCGTLIFNCCIIASLLLATAGASLPLVLAVGIATGAALRLVSQLVLVSRSAWRLGDGAGAVDPTFRRAFVAAAAAASLMLLVPIFVRALASLTGSGSIASFNYATKLVELPVGILVGAASTVALTRLSGFYAAGDAAGASQSARVGLQRAVLIGLAVAVPGICFADAAVEALLARGQMGGAALERVTGLTRIALVGVPFLALAGIAAAALNAQGRSASVLRATLWAVGSLPFLALPGLAAESEGWLMGAVVAFQIAHSALLLRASGVATFGRAGWLTPIMSFRLLLVGALTAAAVLLDRMLAIESPWLRLALATLTFALAAAPALARRWGAVAPGERSTETDETNR